jgi:hypothetical protein
LAADLVRRNVDVIAAGGTPAALAAKWATQTIPIVFMGVGDPVGSGLVAGLARPGGNLTGISEMTTDLMSKRLELLFEMVPQATVIALLVNPNIAITEGVIREVQAAAGATGVQLPILKAGTESEIDAAFAALAELHAGGLVIGPDAFFSSRREQLLGLCHATPFRRSITCVNSPRPAALSPMERASPLYFARPAFTPEGSSRAPSRPICRSSADDVRAGRQSQHRQGARPDCPALDPFPRRRGHRVRRRELMPVVRAALITNRLTGVVRGATRGFLGLGSTRAAQPAGAMLTVARLKFPASA